MNKIIIMGRLTKNPEIKTTQNGISMCRFSVAVDRPKAKDGSKETDFINCQAWRGTADFIAKYFAQGKPIIVEGSLRNNNYTDKNNVTHYGMDVLVDKAEFTLNGQQQNVQGMQGGQDVPQYGQYGQPNYPQQPYYPPQGGNAGNTGNYPQSFPQNQQNSYAQSHQPNQPNQPNQPLF